MKKQLNKRSFTVGAFTVALLVFAVGCKQDTRTMSDGFFPEPEGYRATTATFDAQAGNGARHDAMLRPVHFNGGALNSTGADKINRLLGADAGEPVAVYLNVPTDDKALYASREASVTRYLKDAGLADSQMKVVAGANPDAWSPSEKQIEKFSRTDSGSSGSSDSSSMSTSSSSSDLSAK